MRRLTVAYARGVGASGRAAGQTLVVPSLRRKYSDSVGVGACARRPLLPGYGSDLEILSARIPGSQGTRLSSQSWPRASAKALPHPPPGRSPGHGRLVRWALGRLVRWALGAACDGPSCGYDLAPWAAGVIPSTSNCGPAARPRRGAGLGGCTSEQAPGPSGLRLRPRSGRRDCLNGSPVVCRPALRACDAGLQRGPNIAPAEAAGRQQALCSD